MYRINDQGEVVKSSLIQCRGTTDDTGTSGGSRRAESNKGRCLDCGKRITFSPSGRLKPHGTRRKKEDRSL